MDGACLEGMIEVRWTMSGMQITIKAACISMGKVRAGACAARELRSGMFLLALAHTGEG